MSRFLRSLAPLLTARHPEKEDPAHHSSENCDLTHEKSSNPVRHEGRHVKAQHRAFKLNERHNQLRGPVRQIKLSHHINLSGIHHEQ
ncbi:hypothetical protein PSQ39_21340 [Curvibacter sp. HBC28]|uniref:Secreted protein n=1 Tax=Curvibacter microcysteis TaxID=3026419 RepID=A0ABT5MKT9_9BURK|nr:hypothetical protein [Curvibacter sp. HBC28]MDD0817193.1 hypothetical protein [Curvibacter sp. HBC28]